MMKYLQDLENSASVDVAVREKISKLPPDVSEVKLLSKLEGMHCLRYLKLFRNGCMVS